MATAGGVGGIVGCGWQFWRGEVGDEEDVGRRGPTAGGLARGVEKECGNGGVVGRLGRPWQRLEPEEGDDRWGRRPHLSANGREKGTQKRLFAREDRREAEGGEREAGLAGKEEGGSWAEPKKGGKGFNLVFLFI